MKVETGIVCFQTVQCRHTENYNRDRREHLANLKFQAFDLFIMSPDCYTVGDTLHMRNILVSDRTENISKRCRPGTSGICLTQGGGRKKKKKKKLVFNVIIVGRSAPKSYSYSFSKCVLFAVSHVSLAVMFSY